MNASDSSMLEFVRYTNFVIIIVIIIILYCTETQFIIRFFSHKL